MAATHRLLVRNAAQLVTVCDAGEPFKRSEAMDTVTLLTHASLVVGLDGRIADLGPAAEVEARHAASVFEKTIDATGKCVIPGFCDGHTHAVWSGDRVHEFRMKLAGATYMDVHRAGGGIGFTVKHVRESTEDELAALLRERLDRMLRFGTTLAEIKSGYGLDCDTEMKMLRVIHAVGATHAVRLIATFCGAHSVPQGRSAAEYTREVVDVQIPTVAALRARGEIAPTLADVFMEKGVFDSAQTRAVLEAARAIGLEANFHGDELHPMRAAELAGELGALAMSHCEHVSEEGIAAMARRPTVAVLLPTTAYVLRLDPPPARALIAGGVPVALGSDLNPNAHCPSMPHVMNLACVQMRLTMDEALVAATINAAASMGVAADHGSLEVGKYGDLVVLDSPRWEHVVYQMADPPIETVVAKGVPQ